MKNLYRSFLVLVFVFCGVTSAYAENIAFANPSFEEGLTPYNWQVVTNNPEKVERRTSYGSYLPTHGNYMLCINASHPSKNIFEATAVTASYVLGRTGSSTYPGGHTLLIDILYLSGAHSFSKGVSEVRLNGDVVAAPRGETQGWRTYAMPLGSGPQDLVFDVEAILKNHPYERGSSNQILCVDNIRTIPSNLF